MTDDAAHRCKTLIAAALIQSGQFDFKDFDDHGQPYGRQQSQHPPMRSGTETSTKSERFLLLADGLGNRDWRTAPALVALRRLTDAIHRALTEELETSGS